MGYQVLGDWNAGLSGVRYQPPTSTRNIFSNRAITTGLMAQIEIVVGRLGTPPCPFTAGMGCRVARKHSIVPYRPLRCPTDTTLARTDTIFAVVVLGGVADAFRKKQRTPRRLAILPQN